MQRINFDVICATADVSIDGVDCIFDNAKHFIDTTGFNFPNAKKLFFEPERNIFVIERSGGQCYQGSNQPEFEWVQENLERIKQVAEEINESRKVVVTWRDNRNFLLAITDWMVTRHAEQVQLNTTTSLTSEQYNELLTFRQLLRAMTDENDTFPPTPQFVQLG